MKLKAGVTVSNISRSLRVVCLILLLHICKVSSSPALLAADQTLQHFRPTIQQPSANSKVTSKRQAPEETSNNCTDMAATQVFMHLSSNCIRGIAYLKEPSPPYISSENSLIDIQTVCSKDCAGELLNIENQCPGYYPELAKFLRGTCALNSHGERCAGVLAVNNGSKAYQMCFEETDAFYGCHSRCRDSLIQLSHETDCCFNTFYNDTWGIFNSIHLIYPHLNSTTDETLWDSCGIDYPNACPVELFPTPPPPPPPPPPPSSTITTSVSPTPVSTIAISPPPPLLPSETTPCLSSKQTALSESCMNLIALSKMEQGLRNISEDDGKLDELCSEQCGGMYVTQCGGSDEEFSLALELLCGQYRSELCGSIIASITHTLLHNLSYTCDLESEADCTNECQSILSIVSGQLGCCLYPLTLQVFSERFGINAIDSELWTKCGINLQPHKRCPNPFQIGAETLQQDLPSKNRVWLAGVVVPLVLLILVVGILIAVIIFTIHSRYNTNKGLCKSSQVEGDTADDMIVNQSYSRVTIPCDTNSTRTTTTETNNYTTIATNNRGFLDSSESILQVFDNTFSAPHRAILAKNATSKRTRGARNVEGERKNGEEEKEECDRGFQYSTTANIARNLREDTTRQRDWAGEVMGYANIRQSVSTNNIAGLGKNTRVVYQEPHSFANCTLHDTFGSTPILSPQYHYVHSGHFLHQNIETPSSPLYSTTICSSNVVQSIRSQPLTLSSLPPSPHHLHHSKPIPTPRKASSGAVSTSTDSDDTTTFNYERVEMVKNISYGVPSAI